MSKQISFFINIIIIFLLLSEISYTAEVSIIPLKKPTLNKEVKEEKLSKSTIVPEKKPKQKIRR